MRYALPGSLLVHAAIFGTALVGFAWPEAEDAAAPGAVTVDIVTVSTVSTNTTETIVSSATQTLVSAGAEAVPPPVLEPVQSEMVEATTSRLTAAEPERLDPVTQQTVTPQRAQAVEAVETPVETRILATAMLSAAPVDTVMPVQAEASTVEPVETVAPAKAETSPAEPVDVQTAVAPEVVEPQMVADAKIAPVPHTLSFKRPDAPTARQRPKPQQQAAVQQPAKSRPASEAGNGGRNNADTVAAPAGAGQNGSNGGGGSADTASWERQVSRRLAGALRYPRAANGERGEVVVRFTVAAQGGASGMQVVRSSGHPVLDQAALDTVSRAAPFPPIPANAGFASKTFDFPLGFVRN